MAAAILAVAVYALSRLKLRFAGLLMVGIWAVSMFPPVSLLPSLFQNFLQLGLLNSYTGLILAHAGLVLPFLVWMLASYFATLPVEIEEAARMDGMGFIRIFLTIVLPLALVLMTQNAMRTAPVGFSLYLGEYAFPWETISRATVLAIIPVLIITAIF